LVGLFFGIYISHLPYCRDKSPNKYKELT
jgi:hypothetical protein